MEPDLYQAIVRARESGKKIALATIIARKGSTPRKDPAKMLIYEDGTQLGTVGGGCTEAEICQAALAAIRIERPQLLKFDLTEDDVEESGLICGGTMEVYVEPILPQPCLFIFGAGHVGQCVADAAKPLGFRIAVVDDRVRYASRERFPGAEDIYVESWEKVFDLLPVKDSSYILIATRGHKFDFQCLRYALQTPAKYIGLLGSRRKTAIFFEKLTTEGVPAEQLARVFAPVGLEIGSETPEEIAVSIAAELIAVRKNLQVRTIREAMRSPARADQPRS
jgi:xanthine dehydrogenase accessory factor